MTRIENCVYLARCSLCKWVGESKDLKRGGKKGQSKFEICPGCGKTHINFWDETLKLTNRRSCLVYFGRSPEAWEKMKSGR